MRFYRNSNHYAFRILVAAAFFLYLFILIQTSLDLYPNTLRVELVNNEGLVSIVELELKEETDTVIIEAGQPLDDLLDQTMAINILFAEEDINAKQVAIKKISLDRYFGRLDVYLPFSYETWEGSDILNGFSVYGNAGNYQVDDNILYINADQKLVNTEIAEIRSEIAGQVFFYKIVLSILALIPTVFICINYALTLPLLLLALAIPAATPFHESLTIVIIMLAIFIYVNHSSSKLEKCLQEQPARVCFLTENRKLIYSLLFVIMITGFLLRFINLTNLYPYTDEYFHLVAAKEFLETGNFGYSRASLVTYLTAFFQQIGNASSFYELIYWGRVPAVIFSTLTILPVYFLARKVSEPVGLISAFLWATSPWAIGVGRTIREYAFYPLIILLAVLILIKLLDHLFMDQERQLPKVVISCIALSAFLYYTLQVDSNSTLRISLIFLFTAAIIYGLINLSAIKEYCRLNRLTSVGIIISFVIITFIFINYGLSTSHVSIHANEFSTSWLEYFGTRGTPMQWWGQNNFVYLPFFIAATGMVSAYYGQQRYYLLPMAIFWGLIVFFLFFFDRYSRPRYIIYALPFFIPLIACGINALISYVQLMKPLYKRGIGYSALLLFLLISFNVNNFLYPATSEEHGYIKTTDEYHDRLTSTFEVLDRQIEKEDVFIGTIAYHFLQLKYDIDCDRLYYYDYRDPERFDYVKSIIDKNTQGWLIMDSRRNRWAEGFPKEGSFFIGSTSVEVVQNKDNMQLYRWRR